MAEPEWNDFKIILALSKGGSVAGAARLLGLDASTVSRRLALAEEAFGAVLVLRSAREFSFTSEGRAALETAQSMQSMITSTSNAIRAAKTTVEGLVRISSIPGIIDFLMPFQNQMHDRFPLLKVDIGAQFRNADLRNGEAEIGLRTIEQTEPDLISKQAFGAGIAIYAAKTYVAKYGLPQNPDDLKNHKVILYSKAFTHRPYFAWLDKFVNLDGPITRADSPDMVFNLVLAGGGIGAFNCHRGDTSEELLRVFPQTLACVPGYIVYHESMRNTARIRTTVDMLSQYFKDNHALLSGSGGLIHNRCILDLE